MAYNECLRKYGSVAVWKYCTKIFDYLSLSTIIDGTIFYDHRGLSSSIQTLDQIQSIDRKKKVTHYGPMSNLFWSDPKGNQGWRVSPRGTGYLFGNDVVQKFNTANNIDPICKAHQLVMEGYKCILLKLSWLFGLPLTTIIDAETWQPFYSWTNTSKETSPSLKPCHRKK